MGGWLDYAGNREKKCDIGETSGGKEGCSQRPE